MLVLFHTKKLIIYKSQSNFINKYIFLQKVVSDLYNQSINHVYKRQKLNTIRKTVYTPARCHKRDTFVTFEISVKKKFFFETSILLIFNIQI